jgi:hypothetical protein
VCSSSSQRCRGAGSRLLGGRSALLSLTVSFVTLLPHRDLLRVWLRVQLWVARSVLSGLSMEAGQLLVKLVPGLSEFVEARPTLGVRSVMAWCQVQVGGAARVWRHADEALACEVMRGCLRCPLGYCRARGDVRRSQLVHVGRHQVVWEAWLSKGVHDGVPLL